MESIPYIPESHPFIERLFRTIRNELLDQTLFWGKQDLQIKLNSFKDYYNDTHGHWGLGQLTPNQQRQTGHKPKNFIEPIANQWQSHCSGPIPHSNRCLILHFAPYTLEYFTKRLTIEFLNHIPVLVGFPIFR